MSITYIFVSHANQDTQTAMLLVQHLRDAGHDTRDDELDLSLGDNSIVFMNESIAKAHTVVILFSQYSANAKWQQLEMNSALWNEIAQDGGRCIVLRLDQTPIPPLFGPKVYGHLNPNDGSSLGKAVDSISRVVLPKQTASSVVAEALRPTSSNPFRYLRAEFFENRPDLPARAFAPPDALTVGALEEMKPCFVEGSRGTGKSMLLLSLRTRNFALRHKTDGNDIRIFGFYVKLTRGAICNAGVAISAHSELTDSFGMDDVQLADVAAQEIIIQMIESLFSEISYCISESMAGYEGRLERALAEGSDRLLFDTTANLAARV